IEEIRARDFVDVSPARDDQQVRAMSDLEAGGGLDLDSPKGANRCLANGRCDEAIGFEIRLRPFERERRGHGEIESPQVVVEDGDHEPRLCHTWQYMHRGRCLETGLQV